MGLATQLQAKGSAIPVVDLSANKPKQRINANRTSLPFISSLLQLYWGNVLEPAFSPF
jgi:hypothetical protein